MNYPGELIKKGSANVSAVKAIKKQLNALGYGTLDENNGNFGDSTEVVIKKFQKSKNLISDGVVGELSWDRLFGKTIVIPVQLVPLVSRAIVIAKAQLFVREATGKNDGVDVEKFLKSVGLGKGYAWCAAFVYWCFNEASLQLGVINPVTKTGGVMDHYNRTKGKKVSTPQTGDIFIMDFGGGTGHTGIVSEVSNNRIYTVEGNTSADPTYAGEDREGNGVFERNRTISSCKAFIRYV